VKLDLSYGLNILDSKSRRTTKGKIHRRGGSGLQEGHRRQASLVLRKSLYTRLFAQIQLIGYNLVDLALSPSPVIEP